jgi:hypothetical protein
VIGVPRRIVVVLRDRILGHRRLPFHAKMTTSTLSGGRR